MLEGRIRLEVEGHEPVVLEKGDGAFYRADRPHTARDGRGAAAPRSSPSPPRRTCSHGRHGGHARSEPRRHPGAARSGGSSRAAAQCLVCGEWIEAEATDAYRVHVSNPPREAEYACHEACFERVKHAPLPSPS